MKRVLFIMGSPRGRETGQVAERLARRLSELGGAEVEYLWLRDANLQACRGCELCFMRDDRLCPSKDDRDTIVERIMAADGIVLVSPVYSFHVTALMKNFIDRITYIIHRPRFFHKKALVVATSGGMAKPTLKYLRSVVKAWGCDYVGALSAVHPDAIVPSQVEKQLRTIDQTAERYHAAVTAGKMVSPSLGDLIWFRVWQSNAKLFKLPPDYAYWTEQGWLERDYYYAARLNPLSRLIAKAFGGIMPMFAGKMYKIAE